MAKHGYKTRSYHYGSVNIPHKELGDGKVLGPRYFEIGFSE